MKAFKNMNQEELDNHVDTYGANFNAYIHHDTVVKVGVDEYLNQETQHNVSFTKKELKAWHRNQYINN